MHFTKFSFQKYQGFKQAYGFKCILCNFLFKTLEKHSCVVICKYLIFHLLNNIIICNNIVIKKICCIIISPNLLFNDKLLVLRGTDIPEINLSLEKELNQFQEFRPEVSLQQERKLK